LKTARILIVGFGLTGACIACMRLIHCQGHPVVYDETVAVPRDKKASRPYTGLCRDGNYCAALSSLSPTTQFGATVGILDDAGIPDKSCELFGFWPLGDSGPQSFQWQAEVRVNGAFPSLQEVFVAIGCMLAHPQVPYYRSGDFARATGMFARTKLEDGDVFIPFVGHASLDERYVATAERKPSDDDASVLRVTITVQDGTSPPMSYPDLRGYDRFMWGPYPATVVRLVPPREHGYGEIGWVEVRAEPAVSSPLPSAHAQRR
jgi:hypothetical protein